MRYVLLLAWLVACSGGADDDKPDTDGDADTDADSDADADTDADTDTDTGPVTELEASCTVQEGNVLRFDCAVATPTPGAVQVRLLENGTALATFTSDAETDRHVVPVWGMTPNASYTFEASALAAPDTVVSGEIATGTLPPEVDSVLEIASTGDYDTEYVMFDWNCGPKSGPQTLIVARASDGAIVWYQTADAAPENEMEGYSFTPEGTVLALLGRERLVEWDLGGDIVLDLTLAGGGLAHHVHHAVERSNGLTYVLTARGIDYAGTLYAIDGFDVIDGEAGVVASWSTEGLFDPTLIGATPGSYWGNLLGGDAEDWAHGNAIGLSDTNEAYVSLRFINAIVKVAGDPADPAFGEVDWVLLGEGTNEPYTSDFTLVSSTGVSPANFAEQHHVTVNAAGNLMLWDNRASASTPTRALEIAVDPTTGEADVVEEWRVDQWCPGRGSAFEMPNGNVLGNCSPEYRIMEIVPGTNEEAWSMHPTCTNGTVPDFLMRRAVPVDLFPQD